MKTEFTVKAKTLEEAYAKAHDIYSSLGDLKIEIITQGKKGFLGFGRVDAEIKVIVDDGKEEKRPEEPKNQPQGKAKHQDKNKNSNQPKKEANEQKSAPKKEHAPKNKANEGKTSEPKPAENKPQEVKPSEVKESAQGDIDAKEENINITPEEKTLAMNFLKSFISDIGFNCEVKGDMTVNENGYVSRLITIQGEDAPSLIGHRGDMLDAIQYLSNLCLARKSEGDHKEYVRVIIDIENYREKREQTLRALARRMADKALKYQRNVLLEPMNPYERMIIHSEVQAIEGVSTHSVGYDDNRKIVITCDKKKNHK